MRQRERGSVMLVTMIAIAAVIAGAAVMTSMQSSSSHGAEISHTSRVGLYCAEAGLDAARATIMANRAAWNPALGSGVEPGWLAMVPHDIDGDGAADFTITLRDNDDEAPNDLTRDTDNTVFVSATCTKHPDHQVQVTELLRDTGERKLWIRTE